MRAADICLSSVAGMEGPDFPKRVKRRNVDPCRPPTVGIKYYNTNLWKKQEKIKTLLIITKNFFNNVFLL